ncbi:universal stress protein [Formosa maritima]|uniref:Universal stress protein n=1 Tax=Formosa maritima TaxID=2592046 RepID=A0A5D0GJU1_9FLAO|nr:universal stress protein [Formosa maritima]TYA58047.1 universal stress protein [Formosa maritima]
MRKILIPTDFSDNAMNAIKYALELFKYEISEFYIMHAYQDEIYADECLLNREKLDKVTKAVNKVSLKKLENILKQIKEISPNPRHKYYIVSSNNILVDEADKIVDKENIDLIVMGTRGETNDRKTTFGSHTLQVLKYVQCPVLAIPENFKYSQPKHIMFPTNYMIPYKRRELKLLCEMASPFRGEIDMVYISKTNKLSMRQEDNKNFVKNELCKNKINFITVKNKDITKSIFRYIESKNIDMLVMVNTRHSFLEDMLFQTTIDKISLQLTIPFLALQNMKRI